MDPKHWRLADLIIYSILQILLFDLEPDEPVHQVTPLLAVLLNKHTSRNNKNSTEGTGNAFPDAVRLASLCQIRTLNILHPDPFLINSDL